MVLITPTTLGETRDVLFKHLLTILLLIELEIGNLLLSACRVGRAIALLRGKVSHQLVTGFRPLLVCRRG